MEITHKNQGELDSTMLPFVMRELVELVMKKKALPYTTAGRKQSGDATVRGDVSWY